MYKENPIMFSENFSAENLQARREQHDLLKKLKEKRISQEFFT